MKVILFNVHSTIAVVHPADCGFSLDEIAKRSVPAGVPYYIVDKAVIPDSQMFRNAWELDPSLVSDGVGEGAPL